MSWQTSRFLAAMAASLVFASGASATTIPVSAALDCSAGTACVISGIGGNPIFSGSASTGDVIDITFAGNAHFQPILDNQNLTPWEVSIGGAGTNTGDNVGIGIYLSDMNGDPVTNTAGLSLDGFLSGSDGVSFQSLPVFVHDLHIEIRQWMSANVTRTFTLDQVTVADKPNAGPLITFEAGTWNAVPEPGTLAVLGLGLAGLGLARRRKSRTAV